MLILLAIAVLVSAAFICRVLQAVAPSNLLIARARAARPTPLRAGGLGALALMLAAVAHCLTGAIARGADGWIHLVVLILLWDAMKIGILAVHSAVRAFLAAARRAFRHATA